MRAGPFALVLSSLAMRPASSQKAPTGALKRVDQYIDSLIRVGAFSGSVLIARNDSVQFRRSYGYANVELGVKATDTTRYRLHSITKQFVAAAIMRLALDHALAMSDPIDRHLDSLPPAWRAITIEQLVQHSSGLPQDELKWYSGFDVRAEVKGAYLGSLSITGLASGYNGTPNQVFVAGPQMFGAKGASGMYSTVDDLFQYDRALNRGTIFPGSVVDTMQTHIYRVRPGAGYGYGWIVNDAPSEPRLVHHSGGNNGYTSEYARFPDQHPTIIILSNRGFADPGGMRKRIGELLMQS